MNLPNELHKYMSFEGAKFFLESGNLRYSNPDSFNDPFEFLPQIKHQDNSTKELVDTVAKGVLLKQGLNLIAGAAVSAPWTIISFFSLLAGEDKNKINKQKVDATYNELTNKYRVSCFSETNSSLLMWGHYARSNSGVVISFSTEHECLADNLFQVNYQEKRVDSPNLETLKNPSQHSDKIDSWQKKLIVTKSSSWSYEEEWRSIKDTSSLSLDDFGDFDQIKSDAVLNVIFGCKMPEENKKTLYSIINEKWCNVRCFEAYPDNLIYAIKTKFYSQN